MNRRGGVAAFLLLLMTFVVGGLAGMAIEESLGLDWFDFLDEDAAPEDDRLLAGIDLAPEQRMEIAEVLEKQEDRLEAYWEVRVPEIQEILEDSYREISSLLDSSQRAVFEERLRDLGPRTPVETSVPATD